MTKSLDYLSLGDLVCFKNNQLIAFNKPAGQAVQSKEKPDFHSMAEHYAKRRLYILHRIDQPATGIVLFARNKSAVVKISTQFKERSIKKTYLAVVDNKPIQEEQTIRHFLKKIQGINKSVIVNAEDKHGEEAILTYKHLASSDRYHLLVIDLHTGRHHQIRAQMAAMGCYIKGDVKYGFRRSNPDRSIHLHAWKMQLQHPVTQEIITIEAPLPEETLWSYFKKFL